jgi:hypothetical protein
MKHYTLKAKSPLKNISFTLLDLLQVTPQRHYSACQHPALVDCRLYLPAERLEEKDKEWLRRNNLPRALYFNIRHTSIIVIAGYYLFPTSLSLEEVMFVV